MDKTRKTFCLKINGNILIDLQVEGDDDLVEAFSKQAMTDHYAMFHELKDKLSSIIKDLTVNMHTIARGKDGKFISKSETLPNLK